MNSLRNMVRAFLAVVIVAFALPTSAANPEKIYSINVSPLGTTPVAVTIRNETPNGNSTINSFIIQPPSGVSVTLPPPGQRSSAPADVQLIGGVIQVKSFTGLKAGNQTPKALTIYLNATYGSGTCGASFAWTATVYTGNSFGQEQFAPVVGAGPPPTNATQAATCNYSLTGLPTSIPAGTSTTFTASLKNESPLGSPSITSLALTAPSGVTITSANPVSVNLAPQLTTAIPVSITAPCDAAGGSWGSSANGGTFTRLNALPSLSVTPKCSLAFVQQPQNVISGQQFEVKVKALDGSSNPITNFSGPVALALSGPGSLVQGGSSATGGVVTIQVTITGTGQFTLTASGAPGSGYIPVSTSPPFTVFASGPLNCAPNPPFLFSGSVPPNVDSSGNPIGGGLSITQSGYAEGQRGEFNKDGVPCVPVGYTFTNNILTTNSVTLRWNTTSQPGAAFAYTMTWQDEVPDLSAGVPTRRTKVAWEFDPSGNPLYRVFGVACISPFLPAPYRTLSAAIDATQTTITVTGSAALPPVPFPAAIGSERIQVTAVSGPNWTVVRGTGNLGADAATHPASASVMSSPLPIDPNRDLPGVGPSIPPASTNPYFLKQAQICIADEGWVAVPGGLVRFTTTVFDIGDGIINRDF